MSKSSAPLNITLAPIRHFGKSFYASSQVTSRDGLLISTGLFGRDVDLEPTQEFAWQFVINILTSVQKELSSLDKIDYVTRLGIHVSSMDGFTHQHLVGHGASQVKLNVFGLVSGAHSRTTIGVKLSPLDSPAEVDAIFAIK